MSTSQFPALSRRGFLGLAGGIAAGAALTACAGTGGGGGQGGDANTITFWSNHPGTSKDFESELINRFQAKFPDLTVNLVDAGKNYEEVSQKFNAALSGGELPDVVVLSDVWWFNYALNGTIEPLDGHFGDAGVDLSDYVDSLASDYAFNGKHYALPYARSTPLFYYNKDVWAQAGLPDRGPESWQEFDEWGPRIQEIVGDGKLAHGWGDAKNYLAWTFQGPNWTFGGAYSDEWTLKFTDPGSVAAGTFLRDMIHTKRYAGIKPQIAVDFGTGVIASTIASTGDLRGIQKNAEGKLEFGTAFLPHPNGPGVTTGGAGLAIPARISDERKVNALKFIEFITNTESTVYFSQNTGYMPVRKSAVNDPAEQTFLAQNPKAKVAIDQLSVTKSQDYARVFVPGGDQIIGTGLEQIGLQNADPAAALASVQSQIQTIIDRQITPKLPK
ncbi:ABC transporter substrate-binding protein [Nocardia puris]|uniref:Carbohydrate ABC transporter substrate-binding protein (CUT1 family) n=1 Tax=Nocardia puris TaxID=208602 RepID=A0A366DNG7_9NOCA|nr:ABC transporter substrate-binding protein [Nocardia puris]MBF6213648.1 ABC transporter substrate-binding protein [Nocardia puris]MBF6365422.1 ABC transporter substrate-binding protein [Nocardia puris]MBF6459888.1 ABC transporter substrate-binding protein [Nocardia puris]RBO91631.1 carbohydrate ABC transporter substrate-binding protein (CUT1 family) [Nocardia puris]